MIDELSLTPDERLNYYGDLLLASVIQKGDTSISNRKELFANLSFKVFRDELHILAKVFSKFLSRGITPDASFLTLFLTKQEELLLEATEYIDLKEFSDLDDSPTVAYISAVLKRYTRLMGVEPLDRDDFNLTMEKYKLEFRSIALDDLFSRGRDIVYSGIQIGKKKLQGSLDAENYVKRGLAEIEGLLDTNAGSGFNLASEIGLQDRTTFKPQKIGDFGKLTELNKLLDGIYSGYFYNICAPTKNGKSKMTARWHHNIMVEHGNDVVVWPHEGGVDGWLSQLRAIHFDYLYNYNEPDLTKHMIGIDQDAILKDVFPSDDLRDLEQTSRVDLFTNEKYGDHVLIDRPFHIETFISDIDTAVKQINAKAVLIDYIQLISSQNPGASKSQTIGKAYQDLLTYARKNNVAIISPAQFTQEFIKDMSKSKPGEIKDTRVAGGESSEITRTPDINIAMYGTLEDLANKRMTIMSLPSRFCKTFAPFEIYADLGTCLFASMGDD